MNTVKFETGKEISRAYLTGERPLFHGNILTVIGGIIIVEFFLW